MTTSVEALARAREELERRLAEERQTTDWREAEFEGRLERRIDDAIAGVLASQAADRDRHAREQAELVAALVLRLDALEARWSVEGERLDRLSALSDRLDDVVAALHVADAARDETMVALTAELAAARRTLDDVEPIRQRCAALSQASADLRDDLVAHQAAITGELEALRAQVREVADAVGGDGAAAIAEHLDRLEELERAVAELDPDVGLTHSTRSADR